MNKKICDRCESELDEFRTEYFTYNVTGVNTKESYFIRWELCKPCKLLFQEALEEITKRGKV